MSAPDGYCSIYQAQRILDVSRTRINAIVKQGRLTKLQENGRAWILIDDVERERERKEGPKEPTHAQKMALIEQERKRQEQRHEREQRELQKQDEERAEKQRQTYKDVNEAKFQQVIMYELQATRKTLENISSHLSWLNASLGIVALRLGLDIATELKRKP